MSSTHHIPSPPHTTCILDNPFCPVESHPRLGKHRTAQLFIPTSPTKLSNPHQQDKNISKVRQAARQQPNPNLQATLSLFAALAFNQKYSQRNKRRRKIIARYGSHEHQRAPEETSVELTKGPNEKIRRVEKRKPGSSAPSLKTSSGLQERGRRRLCRWWWGVCPLRF